MDSGELYFNIMADSLNVLWNSDRPRFLWDEENVFNPNDSILWALIEINHNYIVECFLSSDKLPITILHDIIRGYLILWKYNKVLEILLKYHNTSGSINMYNFIDIVINDDFSENDRIDFAEYLVGIDSSLSYFIEFFEWLLRNCKYDLLRKIVISVFKGADKNYLIKFIWFVEKWESSMQLLFDYIEYIINLKENLLVKNIRWQISLLDIMLNVFIKIWLSTEDLEIVSHKYWELMKIDLYYNSDWIERISSMIFKRYLDEWKFDQAETYLKKVWESRFLLEELREKKYAHSIKVWDKETHKELLDEIIDKYNQEITNLEEWKNWEVISSDWNVLPVWAIRIGLCKNNAKKYCEIAIFEIMHWDREKAIEYINIMISYVESISLDIPENCSKRNRWHIIWKHKKPLKQLIKRRFMDLWLFHYLPRKYWWNIKLKERIESENFDWNEVTNNNDLYPQYDQITSNSKIDVIKSLLKEWKINEALEYMDEQLSGLFNYAESEDWDIWVMILEYDKNIYDRLSKILWIDYLFKSDSYYRYLDFEWMGRFLVKAHLLWKINLFEDRDLIGQLIFVRRNWTIWMLLNNDLLLSIVNGFINEWLIYDAYRFFDIVRSYETKNWNEWRMNISYNKCLSSLICAVNTISWDSIYHRAFWWEILIETNIGQWIFRNTKINIALVANNKELYNKFVASFRQLLEKSNNNYLLFREFCRNFKKLNLRDLHLIKEELLWILDLEISKDPRIRRRVVDTMIWQKIPWVESSVEIKRKDNELKVLLFFIKKLIKEWYLTNQTNAFLDLNWKNNIVYLRILLAQYQNESNSTIDAICYDYVYMIENHSISPKVFWSNVFKVLDIFWMITPSIWAESKKVNFIEGEMKEIQRKIKESNSKLFKNVPISEELTQESQAELIYHAFKPVNMSYDSVCNLLSRLEDCSNHLDRYIFPVEWYELSINERKEVRLRRWKDINRNIDEWINLLKKSSATLEKTTIQSISRALCEAWRFKFSEIDEFGIKIFFLLFRSDDYFKSLVWLFLNNDNNRYKYLQVFYDFFNLYLQDNLEQKILDFFELYSEHVSWMWNSFKNSLNEQKKRKAIESQLKIHVPEIIDDKFAAKVIALSLINKTRLVSRSKKQLKSDIKKYVYLDWSEIKSSSVRLRMYVSKNKASFFAKASAWLCTAEDVYSFHREDHFHINIVDEVKHECLWNLMAYDTIYNWKRILLLRWFNPNISLLRNIEVASYCDWIIEVMKRFAVDNWFSGIYIVDNWTWRWALSNRGEISEYLSKMYWENECEFDFEIVRWVFVNKINPVELFEHHEEAYA